MRAASQTPVSQTPFLAAAVVNPEVLRAQEEWEVVDTIHPDTGRCGEGAAQHSCLQNPYAQRMQL